MFARCWVTVCLLPLLLSACGQADPVLMPVNMPECIYGGPPSMVEGEVRVSLTFNGIGESGAALVELIGDSRFEELRSHFETQPVWSNRPSWTATIVELRLERSLNEDGVARTVTLPPGDYAMVCIEYPEGDTEGVARVAAAIEVRGT